MKKKNIQTEIDASYLYQKLAEHETDLTISNVFRKLNTTIVESEDFKYHWRNFWI